MIDRFATNYSTKCAIFNSKFCCPGTAGIDSLKQSWIDELNWVVPPPSFICNTIQKIRTERCKGTLVIPAWQSASYWPLIFPDGINLHYIFTDHRKFSSNIVKAGLGRNGLFKNKCNVFEMIALKFVSY